MNTTRIGQQAEAAAASYLKANGFKLIARNWRIPAAEIDIVAVRGNIIHFIEVKYRAKDHAGGGLSYITRQKLKQMERAASFWCTQEGYVGDYELSAIEVTGPHFEVTEFIAGLSA